MGAARYSSGSGRPGCLLLQFLLAAKALARPISFFLSLSLALGVTYICSPLSTGLYFFERPRTVHHRTNIPFCISPCNSHSTRNDAPFYPPPPPLFFPK